MLTPQVPINLPFHQFRNEMAATFDRVLQGERFVVTRHGLPVVALVPAVSAVVLPTVPHWKQARQRIELDGDFVNPVLIEREASTY